MKKPLLIDGAMGTELNIRGVSTPLPLWSADANLQNSKIVLDIHKDYIKSGSKVITTNTFRTTPGHIKRQVTVIKNLKKLLDRACIKRLTLPTRRERKMF